MPNESDPVKDLTLLLREVGASPRVRPERIARSTLYDLDYHVALIACVFFVSRDDEAENPFSVVAHWLKILQFVAMRPALLPDFKIWARSRRHQDLDTWQKMPRGYLGDNTHDNTVDLLLVGGVLVRDRDFLLAGERFSELEQIYNEVIERDLLQSEREALKELSSIRVNKTLLKGK